MKERKSSTKRPVWLWIAGLILLACLVGALVAWVLRTSIVHQLLLSACAERGLACELEVADVGLDAVSLRAVRVIAPDGQQPFSAEQLNIDLTWSSWLRPAPTRIEADRPKLAARFEDGAFSLPGFSTLFESTSDAATPWPVVRARQGSISLETPAGALAGVFDLDLQDRNSATAMLQLEPASLRRGDDRLQLDSAQLVLTLLEGRVSGTADIGISSGKFDGFTADAALLQVQLFPAQAGRADRMAYRLAARQLSFGGTELVAATGSGEAQLSLGEVSFPSDAYSALRSLVSTFEADRLTAPNLAAQGVKLELDMTRQTGLAVTGPVALAMETVSRGELASARDLVVTGTASLFSDGAMAFDGRATARAIALADRRVDTVVKAISLPGWLGGHQAAFQAAVGAALGNFDSGLTFTAKRSAQGAIALQARRTLRLISASGLNLALEPFGETPWLSQSADGLVLRGSLAIEGGGAPSLSAQLPELSFGPDGVQAQLSGVLLESWDVDGLAVSGDVPRLDVRQRSAGLSLSGEGTLRMTGRLGATEISGLGLFGAIDAVRGSEGWRAQLAEGDCLAVSTDAIAFGDTRMGAFRARLCPPDGRLIQQGPSGPEGSLRVSELAVPVSTPSVRARFVLPETLLLWTGGERLAGNLQSDRLRIDIATGERDLSLTTRRADLGIELGGEALARLSGGLERIRLDGSLVPANVVADSLSFRIDSSGSGLVGGAELGGVLISDDRPDPFYEPVVSDLSASLAGGRLRLSGSVRLAATRQSIAEADIELGLPALDGTITLTADPLVFAPGRLQPADISERLRGHLTNATGSLNAQARLTLQRGAIEGTADVAIRDFGFQTIALGRVSGVNGGIYFNDLLALTSPPSQTVTIAAIDPGIALTRGELKFQLTGGGAASLESATWPFAGGRLSVEPAYWELGASARRLEVRADKIELEQLTDLLQLSDLRAEGTVSGRFPIEFSAGSVWIRDARLAAEAGGGTLRYTGRVGTQAGSMDETVALAFEALRDFRFTVLEVGADGDLSDDILLSARLEGRNPAVLDGQAFNFNVSVDSKLGRILSANRRLTGTDWLAEIVAQQDEP